jgi:hypothetical protein
MPPLLRGRAVDSRHVYLPHSMTTMLLSLFGDKISKSPPYSQSFSCRGYAVVGKDTLVSGKIECELSFRKNADWDKPGEPRHGIFQVLPHTEIFEKSPGYTPDFEVYKFKLHY